MLKSYSKAVEYFENGVVVYPTDTVYGIGCVFDNDSSVKRIYDLKNRDHSKALPLLISDISQLRMLTDDVSESARKLMDVFWPGALTLVFNHNGHVSDLITAGKPTVAVRMPDNPDLRAVIDKLGKPIIGTSANLSGEPSITSYRDAAKRFAGTADMVINGKCHDNIPSTIVDVTDEYPVIIRRGSITEDEIEKVINERACKMKIAIGSDHRGSTLRNSLIDHLVSLKCEVIDCGTSADHPVDYPVIARDVAERVQNGSADYGILICGTGLGMSIAANKFKGIRAALCNSTFMAERARLHNNANILCLGAEFDVDQNAIVDVFIKQEYEGGRHQKRLDMIASFEK